MEKGILSITIIKALFFQLSGVKSSARKDARSCHLNVYGYDSSFYTLSKL